VFKSIAMSALLLVASAFVHAAQPLSGTVYEDRNFNRTWDPGEPGVAGVRVSNGLDVVVTDDAGLYRIAVPDEAVVFITKPRGYATPVNEHQLPQFYYIHQPNGSPPGLR